MTRGEGRVEEGKHMPLWPNFEGSELAPATAKRVELKKVFNATSMFTIIVKVCF